MKVSAKEIAQYVNGSIEGDASVEIWGFGKIEEAKKGEISFLANLKYAQYLYSTEASAILVSKDFQPEHEVQTTLIRVEDPYSALATLLQLSEQMQEKEQGVSEQAYIHPSVKIPDGVYIAPGAFLAEGVKLGKGVRIHPHVYVGKDVSIGDESVLYPSVCLYHKTQIGKRCIIHAGAVIGADGFGFAPQADGYHKIPQMGNVVLEDDVEVGANTCIDRAVMGSTIIEKGVKLDNLVQIGHNVVVSKNTVIAAQAGIAGSTKVGEWNMLGGQSGLAGHIKTAAHVTIAAQTGIISDLKHEKETYFGSPAFPIKTAMRGYSILPKLPEIYRTMGRLEKQVAELQNKLDLLDEKNK